MNALIRKIKHIIRMAKIGFFCSVIVGVGGFALMNLYGFSMPFKDVGIADVVTIEKPEPTVAELLKEIPPLYGISPLVMAAIIDRESAGQRASIRFEPGQMDRARKISKNPEQQRMYASSHGLAQVMGWWAPEFRISWADLYDNRTNIEIACAILKKGLDRHQNLPKAKQLHAALTSYNGSTVYADAVMRKLGDSLIDRNL
jgi:soluble lytic murein transglycosylase-like protein